MTIPRADTNSAGWQTFVLAWWMRFKDEEVLVDQIFTVAVQTDGFRLGHGSERARKRRLELLLNSCRAEVIAGYRVTPNRMVRGLQLWRLLSVKPKPAVVVPSAEWQVIPDGFECPPGGEFKMNLQTGVTLGRWLSLAEVAR